MYATQLEKGNAILKRIAELKNERNKIAHKITRVQLSTDTGNGDVADWYGHKEPNFELRQIIMDEAEYYAASITRKYDRLIDGLEKEFAAL